MCGIVGFSGFRPAAEILIQGLKYLEYRGYDSTGIALFLGSEIQVTKSTGRIENTERLILEDSERVLKSTCGIGHTRWATHGKPSTENAHPHKTGHIALVHNGIIENDLEIRAKILARGYRPLSETDSELIGFLLFDGMEKGQSLEEAARKVSLSLKGQWSIVIMSEREPGKVIGVRNGSPLVASMDAEGNVMIASDAQPLLAFTKKIIFLEPGEIAVGTPGSLEFFDLATGTKIDRLPILLEWTPERLEKNGFNHYMLKEIYEQPKVFQQTIEELLKQDDLGLFQWNDSLTFQSILNATEIVLVACGTSWHASLLGKYWIEKIAKTPVIVEYSSEFRNREFHLRKGAIVIAISQSGETADTLSVIREMKQQGVSTLAITNVFGSSLARESDQVIYTMAGPEIGVAATKTFFSQILTLFLLANSLATRKGQANPKDLATTRRDLDRIPAIINDILGSNPDELKAHADEDLKIIHSMNQILASLGHVRGFLFTGRGYSFPLALEGALKLKEVSYENAEGHPAGELKHGPIAILDQSIVVVAIAPQDQWYSKNRSNIEEVKARGAKVMGIGSDGDDYLRNLCDYWISIPFESKDLHPDLLPFLITPYLQLLGYARGVQLQRDVDKPRNLAKSVTVE